MPHKRNIYKHMKSKTPVPDMRLSINELARYIRGSKKGQKWRLQIKLRDNCTCRNCNKKGKINKMEAHHLTPLSTLINNLDINTIKQANLCYFLWSLDNGITLCNRCHKERHANR